jgi:DNA-binding NtrC family response regulator
MLGDCGFQTTTVLNRREALEQIRETSFNLVIVNMLMPRAEGIGSLIAIGGFAPAMKIIAMSDAQEVDGCDFLPLAKSLGASALLGDPLDPGKLLGAVHSVLDPDLHQVAC